MAQINPDAAAVPFLGYHDQGRITGVLVNDPQQEKQAAALYLLSPGVPFLYYGEELGMTGSGDDENKRLPMFWSASDTTGMCTPPANAAQEQRLTVGADRQESDPDSLLSCYRALLALRNQYPVFVTGEAMVLDTPDARLAAFTLAGEDQTLLVAHNFSYGEALFMPAEGTLLASFDTGDVRSSESAGDAWIAPRSTAVWALR